MLTLDQIEYYRTHGYLGVENVLTPSELEEARRVVDEFVEKSREVSEHSEIFDLEPEHTPERPLLRRLKTPSKWHPFFDGLMRSDAILDLISPLIGPDIRFQGDKLNMKVAEVGSPIEWHQDFAHYPHTNDDLVAVGVALDDCTLENGCLLVIPGSHKGTIYDEHQDGVFVGAISPSRENVDLSKAVPVEVKAGGLTIHHCGTLHASAPNRSSNARRLLFYQYTAVDAWPLAGVGDLDEYDRTIVRGEPTHEYRMTSMTKVRLPLPKPARTGSIFEFHSYVKERAFAGR